MFVSDKKKKTLYKLKFIKGINLNISPLGNLQLWPGGLIVKILCDVAGETGRMYEANVDDVSYRLVAIYTPVREDGVEGHPVSASTEPIAVGNIYTML